MKTRAIQPTGVRIPDELKTWLAEQANKNRRSLNNEIVYRLEESQKQQAEIKNP